MTRRSRTGRTTIPAALVATALAMAPAQGAGAADASDRATAVKAAPTDKSQYTLFNPTPAALLRDLSTDRPDLTESPFTVDAGHIQIETNLFGFTRSRPEPDGTVAHSYDFATTNIRIGVTNAAEINIVFRPYGIVRTRASGEAAATRSAGIGGVDIRGKINLWGNDAFENPGASAFALLPFVTIPTDRSNGISPEAVEAGLILPYALKLTDRIGLGVNAGVHVLPNEDSGGRHAEYLASTAISYEWSDKFGTYYEIAGRFGTQDPRGDVIVLGTGFTYKLNDNLQVDAGINFGITRAADRINPFVGMSARF